MPSPPHRPSVPRRSHPLPHSPTPKRPDPSRYQRAPPKAQAHPPPSGALTPPETPPHTRGSSPKPLSRATFPTFFSPSERADLPHAATFFTRFLDSLVDVTANKPRGRLSFSPGVTPRRLAVSRGDYSSVEAIVRGDGEGHYTIVGPTGCGKSTFALLGPLSQLTSLVVCPTGCNVANLVVEFKRRIPDTIVKYGIKAECPDATYCTFLRFPDCPTPLAICTADQFCAFVERFHTLPPCELLVLDEYHLGSRYVVRARSLLKHVVPEMTTQRPPRVVTVSATPPDEPPPPVRTEGIQVMLCDVPDPLDLPLPPIYLRRNLQPFGDNYLLIIVDSCPAAHTLRDRIRAAGESAFCLCRCTNPEAATKFLNNHASNMTAIATPDTESGITVPCSHMVNRGDSLVVEMIDGVIVPQVRPLGARQANQRLGRAGRVCFTLVYQAPPPAHTPSDNASLVLLGEAYLHILAKTGGHPDTGELKLASDAFSRLRTLSRSAAQWCLLQEQPMAAVYKVNDAGEKYREFGGKATTFVKDNSKDFKLFHWPGGAAYGPYLDLCSHHDLTQGMTLELQRSISDEILRANPDYESRMNISSALKAAAVQPDVYAQAIWMALKTFSGPSNMTVSYKAFLASDMERTTPRYMFGPIGEEAWQVLARRGAKIRNEPGPPRHEGDKALETTSRICCFNGEEFSFTSADILSPTEGGGNRVDDEKVSAALIKHLRPLMATSVLIAHPKVAVNLASFARHRGRSSNSWFNSLFPDTQ
jgi:hypothetical protein